MSRVDRVETLHCPSCGRSFERTVKPGPKRIKCPECRNPEQRVVDLRTRKPCEEVALNATNCRLGLEMARSALMVGRYRDALEAIDGALAATDHVPSEGSRA